MSLVQLVKWAQDKSRFNTLHDYSNFCEEYLSFIFHGLQAVIVSRNENNYRFFQYREDGNYNVTRPINSNLMLSADDFSIGKSNFDYALQHIREIQGDREHRQIINKFVYTCQQAIGAALDALPAGQSNRARKIHGDLFERYIRFIFENIGIDVHDGVVHVPVIVRNETLCNMSYQHDLIVEHQGKLRAVGSVKTSSKDRLDKIFIEKFLYNRLTNAKTPHFAIFLNDVQRKGREQNFTVHTTFKSGHFKAYSIKLNPLDGVYYCDIRPNMITDKILSKYIHSFDVLIVDDIWNFIE